MDNHSKSDQLLRKEKFIGELRRALKLSILTSGLARWVNKHKPSVKRLLRSAQDAKIRRILHLCSGSARTRDGCLLAIKKACHHLRSQAISGGPLDANILGICFSKGIRNHLDRLTVSRKRTLYQLSRLGRALPACESAWLKNKVTKEFIANRSAVSNEVSSQSLGLIRDVLQGYKHVRTFSYGALGATVETPRRKGGFRKDLHDLVLKDHPEYIDYSKSGRRYNVLDTIPPVPSEGIPSKTVFISEQGFKYRIVQKGPCKSVSESAFNAVSLRNFLSKLPQVAAGLAPDKKIYMGRWKTRSRKFYSVDFSNATDRFALSAIRFVAAVLQVSEYLFYTPQSQIADQVIEIKSGTDMGLPLSFPFLTLVHYACCKSISNRFVIRGDDAVGYWTPEEYQRYKDLVTEFGLSLNLKKIFEDHSSAVFCEELYEAVLDSDRLYLVQVPTISIKALSQKVLSLVWVDLDQFAALLGCSVEVLSTLPEQISKSLVHWIVRRLRHTPEVIPFLFLPKVVGGFGFPPNRKYLSPNEMGILGRVLCGHKIPSFSLRSSSTVSKVLSKIESLETLGPKGPESEEETSYAIFSWASLKQMMLPRSVWFSFLKGELSCSSSSKYSMNLLRRFRKNLTTFLESVEDVPFLGSFQGLHDELSEYVVRVPTQEESTMTFQAIQDILRDVL